MGVVWQAPKSKRRDPSGSGAAHPITVSRSGPALCPLVSAWSLCVIPLRGQAGLTSRHPYPCRPLDANLAHSSPQNLQIASQPGPTLEADLAPDPFLSFSCCA